MNYFTLLPKDILYLFVKKYVRSLDYHRLLRVSKIFHILNDKDRINKEIQRFYDQKKHPNRAFRYRRMCGTCGCETSKKRKHRHRIDVCERLMSRQRNNNFQKHIEAFTNRCGCKFTSTFYFPIMAKHHETCDCQSSIVIINYPLGTPYPLAKHKWKRRLLAQERNTQRKRIWRECMNQQGKSKDKKYQDYKERLRLLEK